MRQYTLNDMRELLTLINEDMDTLNLNDIQDLHPLNILFLIQRHDYDTPLASLNILPFLATLRKYLEQYNIFINELLDFCTKVTFKYLIKDINYIKILYLNEMSIEEINKKFTLKDEYIKDLIEIHYYKDYTYDEVQNAI